MPEATDESSRKQLLPLTCPAEVKQFKDPTGKTVFVVIPIDGSPPRFIGVLVVEVRPVGAPPNVPSKQEPSEFYIDAHGDTLEAKVADAFALYDATMQASQEDAIRQVQQRLAVQQQRPQLVDAMGQQLRGPRRN